MTQIIVPSRRILTQQPQQPVALYKAAANELVFDWSAAIPEFDTVGGLRSTIAAGNTHAIGPYGKQRNFSGSQAVGSFSFGKMNALVGKRSASWDVLVYLSNVVQTAKFFSQWAGVEQTWIVQTSGTTLIWVACDGTGGRTRFDLSNAFPTAGWYRLILAWRGGTSRTVLVNGVDKTASSTVSSAAATAFDSGVDPIQIGVSSDAPLAGAMVLARVFGRGLSLQECQKLHDNPFGLYQRQRIAYFDIGAPAAATLEGHAQAQAAATGNLTLSASLDGLALSVATSTGQLTTQIPVSGAAVAVVSAAGNLLTGIRLSANAVASAVATGNLSAQIRLDGAALAQAAASAGLTSTILLAGNAQGQAGASGTLAGGTSGLAGDAHAAATAIATLTTSIRLSGTAAAAAGVNGLLTTQVPLTAAALAQAIATGTLSVAILLAGDARVEASASGVLGDATEPEATVHFRLSADVARLTQAATSVWRVALIETNVARRTRLVHEVKHV